MVRSAALATVATVGTTYFLPPKGGWFGAPDRPPSQILADIERMMGDLWDAPYTVQPDRMIVTPEMYKNFRRAVAIGARLPERYMFGDDLPVSDGLIMPDDNILVLS